MVCGYGGGGGGRNPKWQTAETWISADLQVRPFSSRRMAICAGFLPRGMLVWQFLLFDDLYRVWRC